ncbi:MAG: DNA-methyltransferase [Acidimicrobiales bacterium]
MTRRSTSTSSFGTSRRESHDASAFYSRFKAPEVSADDAIHPHKAIDKLIVGDARQMPEVPDASVALVVTSPPYFSGKEYELALGTGAIPATYLEYLALLRDVFAECCRKLEPGGRIAVNVANLGRRPYRSLSGDVVRILQDDLGLLLRGEILWVKQKGASGSCAWGSFQSPANPVLRDLTERVVVASKGRFDRALKAPERAALGLPFQATCGREEFMADTLDVWEIAPESARRVGHPAPFPVELPERLVELFTYFGDLVLDPFVGAGSTAVAALRCGRHFAGYDLDEGYIQLAEQRVAEERQRLLGTPSPAAVPSRSAKQLAQSLLEQAGFTDVRGEARQPGGVKVSFAARGSGGKEWLFELCGGLGRHSPGLERGEVMWRSIGRATVLAHTAGLPLVLLSPKLPPRRSGAWRTLQAVCGPGRPVHAVVDLTAQSAPSMLRAICGS